MCFVFFFYSWPHFYILADHCWVVMFSSLGCSGISKLFRGTLIIETVFTIVHPNKTQCPHLCLQFTESVLVTWVIAKVPTKGALGIHTNLRRCLILSWLQRNESACKDSSLVLFFYSLFTVMCTVCALGCEKWQRWCSTP